MTYPRHTLVMEYETGFYHCVSRCVRRAFLCGRDPLSGRDFSHRRRWIENRIHLLASVFSVSVYAYAVMSNHVHIAVHVDPRGPWQWSDSETARRWLTIFPGRRAARDASYAHDQQLLLLVTQKDRLEEIRRRLGSLSWFMRSLNEAIARRANKEDECTGRFWEGRFKCQALLDEAAIIACMAYIDLNPLRAGASRQASRAPFTSARLRQTSPARLEDMPRAQVIRARPLAPVAGSFSQPWLQLTEADYLDFVEQSAKHLHPEISGSVSTPQLISPPYQSWLRLLSSIETHFFRAIGSASALFDQAARLGQRWIKGARFRQYPNPTVLASG